MLRDPIAFITQVTGWTGISSFGYCRAQFGGGNRGRRGIACSGDTGSEAVALESGRRRLEDLIRIGSRGDGLSGYIPRTAQGTLLMLALLKDRQRGLDDETRLPRPPVLNQPVGDVLDAFALIRGMQDISHEHTIARVYRGR